MKPAKLGARTSRPSPFIAMTFMIHVTAHAYEIFNGSFLVFVDRLTISQEWRFANLDRRNNTSEHYMSMEVQSFTSDMPTQLDKFGSDNSTGGSALHDVVKYAYPSNSVEHQLPVVNFQLRLPRYTIVEQYGANGGSRSSSSLQINWWGVSGYGDPASLSVYETHGNRFPLNRARFVQNL
ncbi:hypothetical protein EVAR_26792_1 [Eumeta japonica]|uniref:Uncharacterized protein n=1 Tax=Eumeta variegata TaxID=151549 RepID=A0A4C1WG07_EUMVA|nr:hypothetical protein EVAR_26792_1 [Eumeta japonica]